MALCFESVRESGGKLPTITEELQERCLSRITGRAKFIDGVSASAASQGVSDQVASHLEPNLLALCYGLLREMSAAILFLASDAASYITGTIVPVGGGDQG